MDCRVLGTHHLAVQATDLLVAERFYVELLGLRVKQRWYTEGGEQRSIWVDTGDGSFIALERSHPGVSPASAGRPFLDGHAGWHLVSLRIDPNERAAWERRLASAGVAIEHRTRWTLYLRDPDGNRVGLSHHPHDAPLASV